MKKYLLVSFIAITSVALVGCSSSNNKSGNSKSSKPQTVSVPKNEDVYFKDNVAKLKDVKIEITQEKILNPGEQNNIGDKPVIAFWYKVTNLSNKEIDPTTAWASVFEAYQDNNKNRENKLNVGSLPDDKFSSTQLDNIKKDGTVENAVSYELSDTTTPVQLKATQGIGGKTLGTQEYKLK